MTFNAPPLRPFSILDKLIACEVQSIDLKLNAINPSVTASVCKSDVSQTEKPTELSDNFPNRTEGLEKFSRNDNFPSKIMKTLAVWSIGLSFGQNFLKPSVRFGKLSVS